MEILGKAPINKVLFVTCKIALFAVVVAPAVSFILPSLVFYSNLYLQIAAMIFAVFAIIFLFFSSISLGESTAMGLPKGKTKLKTSGIYKFTRNPMYIGLFLLCIASSVYTFNPVVSVMTIYIIVIHHNIVKSEENFLAKRFGKDWVNYSKKVGRYF